MQLIQYKYKEVELLYLLHITTKNIGVFVKTFTKVKDKKILKKYLPAYEKIVLRLSPLLHRTSSENFPLCRKQVEVTWNQARPLGWMVKEFPNKGGGETLGPYTFRSILGILVFFIIHAYSYCLKISILSLSTIAKKF